MKTQIKAGVVFLIVLIILMFVVSSIQGKQYTYEITPEIHTPHYGRTDASYTIDAYERLMHRYMDMSERNFDIIHAELRQLHRVLESMDKRLKKLDTRTQRIEKALGIVAPKPEKKIPATKPPEETP